MHKNIGVIVCDDDPTLGEEDGVGRMTIDLFKKHQYENWEYFKAVSGHLPDKSNLESYNGFILTGSYWSVNDQHKWIEDLMEFIKLVFQFQHYSDAAPKLFGICFGHQLISKSLGANVIKNKNGKFILSQADVQVLDDLQNKQYYRQVFHDKQYISVIQCHEEEVINLPSNAVRLATSKYCENEIISYGDKILTMQGHMDISEDLLIGQYLPTLKDSGKLDDDDESFLFDSLNGKPNDCSKIVEMIRQFLNLD
ncbi:uncharacterized protein LOC105844229 [Hydra vulgaris]|uniref:uncharacterized protein LOC105844229 n=1 Tax=Hydra vulgaris TaxID=6087 RepID=UPI0006411D39|nr:gamma-glutamyl peptidase 1 [Hydra vulgaris]